MAKQARNVFGAFEKQAPGHYREYPATSEPQVAQMQ